MNQQKTVTLQLDANEMILNPLLKVLGECSKTVLFGLQTIDLVDRIPENLRLEGGLVRFESQGNEMSLENKKEKYKIWLVKKGFEDLVKGIEFALQNAYVYASLLSRSSEMRTVQEFEQVFSEIRKTALDMHIPDMIKRIEPLLVKPWSYKKQILSINKTRTCLVHRDGLVIEKDVNDEASKSLKLEWVRFKIFYEKNGEEIEILGGEEIVGGTQIMIRREDNTISFKQGSCILLNFKQFNECIITCYHFGVDLVDCLPKNIR